MNFTERDSCLVDANSSRTNQKLASQATLERVDVVQTLVQTTCKLENDFLVFLFPFLVCFLFFVFCFNLSSETREKLESNSLFGSTKLGNEADSYCDSNLPGVKFAFNDHRYIYPFCHLVCVCVCDGEREPRERMRESERAQDRGDVIQPPVCHLRLVINTPECSA